MHFEGLEYKDELDAFVTDIAKAICAQHGLNPDGSYEVVVGYNDDGSPVVAEMPNYERFDDDVRYTCEFIFGLSSNRLHEVIDKWRMYKFAQSKMMEKFEETEAPPELVNRLLE